MYKDINIILATKHKKETVIREPFETAFSSSVFVPADYDTDQFGTFTGEVIRKDSAYDTVVMKAKKACELYEFNYGIASEGCFGPHPMHFYLPADIEFLTFVDLKNDIVVVETDISTETNYSYKDITSSDDFSDFLIKSRFENHGLVMRSIDNDTILAKGIIDLSELHSLLKEHFKQHEKIRLETDMRAMMNPTRMKLIEELTHKLIVRLKTTCNACHTPGFGKISTAGKLPCQSCGTDTNLYEMIHHSCVKCDYIIKQPRADGLSNADPMHCPLCNP